MGRPSPGHVATVSRGAQALLPSPRSWFPPLRYASSPVSSTQLRQRRDAKDTHAACNVEVRTKVSWILFVKNEPKVTCFICRYRESMTREKMPSMAAVWLRQLAVMFASPSPHLLPEALALAPGDVRPWASVKFGGGGGSSPSRPGRAPKPPRRLGFLGASAALVPAALLARQGGPGPGPAESHFLLSSSVQVLPQIGWRRDAIFPAWSHMQLLERSAAMPTLAEAGKEMCHAVEPMQKGRLLAIRPEESLAGRRRTRRQSSFARPSRDTKLFLIRSPGQFVQNIKALMPNKDVVLEGDRSSEEEEQIGPHRRQSV